MSDKKDSNSRSGSVDRPAKTVALRPQPQTERLAERERVGTVSVVGPSAGIGSDIDSGEQNPVFEGLVHQIIGMLGEDPDRQGLVKTPQRVASSLTWLTRGYGMDVNEVVGDAVFEEEHTSMIMVRDIELYSLCEHHMLPFFGKAHIAYIPDGRIVGLSKLARVVEVFARRLQVQERLTEEIAQAIQDVLNPKGVGVVIEAYHLCMMMRGVQKQNSQTVTSAVRGIFRNDARTREEFLTLAHGRPSRFP